MIDPDAPEGFSVVEEQGFSFWYPDSWPEATVKRQPLDQAITLGPYSVSIQYQASEENWKVVAVHDWSEEKVGDIYDLQTVAENDRLTVYKGGFGEGGCGYPAYYFVLGDEMVRLSEPGVYYGTDSNGNDTATFSVNGQTIESKQLEADRSVFLRSISLVEN